jgi:hypothetical protein
MVPPQMAGSRSGIADGLCGPGPFHCSLPGSCRGEYHTDRPCRCSVRRMTVKPGWARKRDRQRRREADAAPTNTAGPPWVLSAADWRLLVVTFIGGLGSIVAAACVVGGAISLARRVGKAGGLGGWGLVTVWALILTAVALTASIRTARIPLFRDDPMITFLRRSINVTASLVVALALMVWIGVAAGIK